MLSVDEALSTVQTLMLELQELEEEHDGLLQEETALWNKLEEEKGHPVISDCENPELQPIFAIQEDRDMLLVDMGNIRRKIKFLALQICNLETERTLVPGVVVRSSHWVEINLKGN